jgi:hypothetical protein
MFFLYFPLLLVNKSAMVYVYLLIFLVTLDQIWHKVNMIEVHQRQQTRLLQSILVSVQSRGVADDSATVPDGINLPNKTLSELLDMEKKIQSTENYQRMVSNVIELCFLLELFFLFKICGKWLSVVHSLLV